MLIPEDKREKVLDRIRRLPHFPPCVFCGCRKSTTNNSLNLLPAFRPTPDNVGAPVVTVSCDGCGYVHHFSAVVMGLVDKQGNLREDF